MASSRLRYVELLEGGGGNRLSMTRLLMFLAFWPATYVVVTNPDEGFYSWYLSAYVLSYIGGKTADRIGTDEHSKKPKVGKNPGVR
jgi:hypothetical protein